jgi:O-antigen biosynthesis protein
MGRMLTALRDLYRDVSGDADSTERFLPITIRTVELSTPVEPIVAERAREQLGQEGAYGSALVLARLNGEPIGLATVPLTQGRATAELAAAHLWASLHDRILERAGPTGAKSCRDGNALLRGLDGSAQGRPLPSLEPSHAPYVTVVVATTGRDELDRCLRSLRSLRYPRYDVLVVDNAPASPSARRIVETHAREDRRIRYTPEPFHNLSVARNHGIMRTDAQIVAFTDDDVIVDPDWLLALVQPFLRDPAVAGVTGLVLPAELETRAQWYFEEYRAFGRGFEPRVFDLDRHKSNAKLLYPYWGGVVGSGNSMAFSRGVLLEVGGFDPALGGPAPTSPGVEDADVFTRLLLRGHRLTYEPRAVCWHAHRRDEEALRRQLFSYGLGLTALLTKWVLRRPTLALSIVAAIPKVVAGSPTASPGRRPGLPWKFRRAEIAGYFIGPALYARSRARTKRHRLTTPRRQSQAALQIAERRSPD